MLEKISYFIQEIEAELIDSAEKAEQFRLKFLSKKGVLNELFEEFKTVANEQKKELGKHLNILKQKAQEKFDLAKENFENSTSAEALNIDITLPGEPFSIGSHHPISIVRREIIDIFSHIGFTVAEGPEIEDDWHNFTSLNFPPDHPARDMQDTFFIEDQIALRTHTSSIQIRVMENQKPPIRILAPGRVYRNEAISARAHCFFHQIEGLYIDEHV
ncbi:MAG: phenylalanine--tRNA ligase subunit alpha, partial [Bacteroidia bacterium]